MNQENLTDAYAIARFIKEAQKVTPVKLYLKGDLDNIDFTGLKVFGEGNSRTVFGEVLLINQLLETNKHLIEDYVLENDRRNSAIPLLDIT
ncbi:MAG: 2,3,4,5-tetrahydropyridine-2,6-dicarboxylate N-acetyltransferase, partial [Clostridiales bacterium]|nr:2,3,4,5-tetrahydropyridine-2,6-dicarboxylate N-acetyltransferase [Clostridiales bacterium]